MHLADKITASSINKPAQHAQKPTTNKTVSFQQHPDLSILHQLGASVEPIKDSFEPPEIAISQESIQATDTQQMRDKDPLT